jgi:hypothetical protein
MSNKKTAMESIIIIIIDHNPTRVLGVCLGPGLRKGTRECYDHHRYPAIFRRMYRYGSDNSNTVSPVCYKQVLNVQSN